MECFRIVTAQLRYNGLGPPRSCAPIIKAPSSVSSAFPILGQDNIFTAKSNGSTGLAIRKKSTLVLYPSLWSLA